jgi:hypothetical protein
MPAELWKADKYREESPRGEFPDADEYGPAAYEAEEAPRRHRRPAKGKSSKHKRGVDEKLVAAANGAKMTPRTRDAVVAAAIDRLLGAEKRP